MLRSQIWIPAVLIASVAACGDGGVTSDANDNALGDTNVLVIQSDAHDVSPPLAELARRPVPFVSGRAHEAEPWRRIPHPQIEAAGPVVDPVVQSAIGGPDIPTPITTFEGMGTGLPGFTVRSAPPDTDGDIGPNHYVQIVNSGVTIFSRTGAVLLGPVNTNTLWNGFSGACATTNDGDGVVRYDRIANRWVISQFSVNGGNGPFFQCVAVSTTPDPTGTYNRYQFTFDGFNDYPKMGLWPDAYYFTFNMFPNNTFAGSRLCAFDRAKMLTGAAATEQCFNTSNQIGGLLASDLDGSTLPPAGSPNFAVALSTTTTLAFFKTHIDFAAPTASTFTGPTTITIASFAELCNGATCVTQPGTTTQLDSLADRAMNRLVYRKFSDGHDAMVVSHSVTAGNGGGVRWYELRNMATTPTVFQQGTYAPDAAFRWMPSMTFDQAGNIGIGFSTSSSTINPSVRYTGRLAGDALGTMGQGEATIVAGTGSQTGNLTRWGDYSSMNIDPTDDCTFWFTSEYISANGSFNWRTRVGTFKFPSCGAQINDFSISVNPTSQTVAAGSSTTYTVSTAVTAGTAQTVNLSVSGLPTGVTGSFNPTSVTAGGSSTLTLTVAATTAAGTTNFTITGTGTSATHTTNASVTVTNNNQAPTVSITSPANGSTVSGTITVSANAADADGTVASVRFDLPDGTSVTDTTAPFSAAFDTTKVANGSRVFTATATDNQGATAVATVTVTVANNQAPTVSITSPANGSTVSGTITVSANAADADGTVASVRFDLPDGTSVTDTTAPFSAAFDTTKVANGSRVFTATATDNQGATAVATVTVTVANNQAPTVSITSPANGSTVSGTITVSATAADADGTVASVKFDLPDGTSVTDTTAPFSAAFDTTKVANGSRVFTATATDNQGATAVATVTVTVANNQAPTVSITSPANGSTVSGTITVSANASDADGTIASVKFNLPDGTSVTDTTAPFSAAFDTTKVANGSRVFTATATDNQGATAVATVTVTVANNQAPTVSITSPANGSTVSGTITVSANASDPDGTIASVKFDLPDGTSVTDTTAPFSAAFDTTKVANGSRVFRATATDNQGATAVATVTVTVANNQAPTVSITSPANGSTVSGTITVSATAADADGTVASVKFDLPDGTSVTDTTAPFSAAFDTTKVANGSRVFTATATDNQGATGVATVTVTVANNQAPTVSITSPANGSTVSGTITVSATAADADGTVASVKFDLPDGTSVTDTTAPFSTTFDTTKVANGSYTIQATATDNQGATAVATVTVTVHNCLDTTFSAKDTPSSIPDNDPLGLTSSIEVTSIGDVVSLSLSLSLDIAHPFRSDLMVTLISPAGTQFSVSSRQGDSQDNLVIVDQAITAFDGEALAGIWQLTVRDLAKGDVGTLNSWFLTLRESCSPTAQ